jgi:hypothetical protein
MISRHIRFSIGMAICAVLLAQSRPPWLQQKFENGDLSGGKPGEFPPGWHLGPEGTPDYAAEITPATNCSAGKQCATVKPVDDSSGKFSFLHQIYEADQFRGKQVKLRANVRVSGNGYARLLVRIHRMDGSTSFRDDMGAHPIQPGPWAFYEINAPIPMDARDIELGMQDFDQALAAIDQISVTYLP